MSLRAGARTTSLDITPSPIRQAIAVVAAKEQQIADLPEKFQPDAKERAELDALFARVHEAHGDVSPGGKTL